MATYRERNGRVTAMVHIKPYPRTAKTFGSEAEARAWACTAEIYLRERRKHERGETPRNLTIYNPPPPPADIMRLPRVPLTRGPGIYFLFDGDTCVYVGQSIQVHARAREHFSSKKYDSYSWLPVPASDLSRWEQHYITLLRPRLNIALLGPPGTGRIVRLGDDMSAQTP